MKWAVIVAAGFLALTSSGSVGAAISWQEKAWKACVEGDVSWCRNLGMMLAAGQGGPKDLPRARVMFKNPAMVEMALGVSDGGLCYPLGRVVPKICHGEEQCINMLVRSGTLKVAFF